MSHTNRPHALPNHVGLNASHPILRTKSNVESYVCQGISHTHKMTNYIVSSQVFITYRIIFHDKSIKSIKETEKRDNYSSRDPPNSTGTVDWWTISLVILRKRSITAIICYPSGKSTMDMLVITKALLPLALGLQPQRWAHLARLATCKPTMILISHH